VTPSTRQHATPSSNCVDSGGSGMDSSCLVRP
jgi:hypothetical protein